MTDEWGPIIEHDGAARPVPADRTVWFVYEAGKGQFHHLVGLAGDFEVNWQWKNWHRPSPRFPGKLCARIVRYRVRKPRALQQLIELAERPVAPVKEDVAA